MGRPKTQCVTFPPVLCFCTTERKLIYLHGWLSDYWNAWLIDWVFPVFNSEQSVLLYRAVFIQTNPIDVYYLPLFMLNIFEAYSLVDSSIEMLASSLWTFVLTGDHSLKLKGLEVAFRLYRAAPCLSSSRTWPKVVTQPNPFCETSRISFRDEVCCLRCQWILFCGAAGRSVRGSGRTGSLSGDLWAGDEMDGRIETEQEHELTEVARANTYICRSMIAKPRVVWNRTTATEALKFEPKLRLLHTFCIIARPHLQINILYHR